MTGSPMIYLFLTSLKNRIKGFIKKPLKLLYVLFFVGLFVFSAVGVSKVDDNPDKVFRPMSELFAGAAALYLLIFILTAISGFSRGGSMFKMQDVNFLFTSPMHPRKLLWYGILRQMGTSLTLGLFLLYQYAWLHSVFGITFPVLLIFIVGYSLSLFCGQLTAMVIYSFTNRSDKLRGILRAVFWALLLAFPVYLAVRVLLSGLTLSDAAAIVMGPSGLLLPVAGWIAQLIAGVLQGSSVIGGALLLTLFVAALGAMLLFGDPDYYEDVLETAEYTYNILSAQKEGVVAEAVPKNVKLGKIGLQGGWGSNAFYFKHRLENRRSRVLLISPTALIFSGVSILFSVFMKGTQGAAIGVLAFSVYMQIFSVALGRLNKELTKPFIYLVPEPSVNKLIQCSRELLPGAVAQAILIFVPVAFLLSVPPILTVSLALAHISYSILFTAGLVVLERLWGGASKSLTILLFFVVLLVLSAPGVAIAVFASSMGFLAVLGEGVPFILITVCNIAVAALAAFLCSDMLENADFGAN